MLGQGFGYALAFFLAPLLAAFLAPFLNPLPASPLGGSFLYGFFGGEEHLQNPIKRDGGGIR